MKKRFSPLLFLLVLTACGAQPGNENSQAPAISQEQPASQAPTEEKAAASAPIDLASESWAASLSGSLDDKIMIDLDLAREGKLLKGTLTYKSQGKPIRVFGNLNGPSTFFMREYAKGTEVSGMLSGEFKGSEIVGSWYPPTGDKERKLSLKVNGAAAKSKINQNPKQVAGKYSYKYPNEGGSGALEVSQKGNQIHFDVSAVNGAPGYHIADISEATGDLKGNVATCLFIPGECEFTITFLEDFVLIDWIEDRYECEFGMGASIEGIFVKE